MKNLKDCPEYEAFLRGIYQNVQYCGKFGYWTKKEIARPDFNDTGIRRVLTCKIQDVKQYSKNKIF